MEPQNFLQRGLVTAQCECPRWFSHTSRLCAFLGRTKTLYFFGPITCCLTPGFLNGATFPPTKQWDRDKGHLDSPFLRRRQGQGQQWVYKTFSHTMLDQTLAPWLGHDSEFPELLVLQLKLEWIFKEALDSVSDSESYSHFVHCQHSPQMTKEYSRRTFTDPFPLFLSPRHDGRVQNQSGEQARRLESVFLDASELRD